MTKNPYIAGVGGWLALLIVGLMFLGPLMGFGKLSSEFSDALEQYPQLADNVQWQNYRQLSWLIFAATASVSFAAGYRLWQIHSAESVRFAIVALWLIGPTGNVLHIASATAIFGSLLGQHELAQMIGGTVASCVVAGSWTTYLLRSHRVKNTYRTWQTEKSTTQPSTSSTHPDLSWWRRRSKHFRVWVFASAVWACAVILYVVVFEPYGSWMDGSEYFNMFLIMLSPPLLIGGFKYAYDRWVR